MNTNQKKLKIFLSSQDNKKIPKDIIIFALGNIGGWFGFWEEKWYGDYVILEDLEDSDNLLNDTKIVDILLKMALDVKRWHETR